MLRPPPPFSSAPPPPPPLPCQQVPLSFSFRFFFFLFSPLTSFLARPNVPTALKIPHSPLSSPPFFSPFSPSFPIYHPRPPSFPLSLSHSLFFCLVSTSGLCLPLFSLCLFFLYPCPPMSPSRSAIPGTGWHHMIPLSTCAWTHTYIHTHRVSLYLCVDSAFTPIHFPSF